MALLQQCFCFMVDIFDQGARARTGQECPEWVVEHDHTGVDIFFLRGRLFEFDAAHRRTGPKAFVAGGGRPNQLQPAFVQGVPQDAEIATAQDDDFATGMDAQLVGGSREGPPRQRVVGKGVCSGGSFETNDGDVFSGVGNETPARGDRFGDGNAIGLRFEAHGIGRGGPRVREQGSGAWRRCPATSPRHVARVANDRGNGGIGGGRER